MLLNALLIILRSMLSNCIDLHIGGVFPMEAGSGGWAGGQACLPAVQMALDDVNANRNLLIGYNLTLHHHNSKCQPGLAAKQLYELLYKPPTKLILLAGCSPVTTVIAEAAPVWNLVVLSYGGSSPALSSRKRFPTLFRTHPTANMQNPTRVKLFQKFKWKRITIIQSVEEVFTTTAKDLENLCRENGIRVERQSFYGDPTDAVKALVRQDARIIIGLFYVTEARRVLCQAFKHGLYGRKFVWFFIGWYADTWFIPPIDEPINCTAEQMKLAAQYHFTTESIMLSRDQQATISGMTGLEFQERLRNMIKTDPANTGGFPEAPLAYDAVWAIALALNCTLEKLPSNESLENFSYNNTIIASQIFNCVKDTLFKGVSGAVMFSDSGDRIARTQIEQLQDGKYQMIGIYDTTTFYLEWYNKEKFATPNGLAPPDSTIIQKSFLTVNLEIYYAVAALVAFAIILAVFALIFNLKFADKSVIIQSQPQCNNLFLFGCILCSISLLLIGLPANGISLPRENFTLLCHSRISILMVGFTFAYGSMFAKMWIVHRVGAAERQKSNDPIPANKFYGVVAVFVLIDFIIIILWIILDPLYRKELRFSLQEPPPGTDEDIMLLPVMEFCQSEKHQVWTGIIMGYKCLLLVFGLFVAYESRNLKIRYINDSRFVGLAIYNVTILSLVTGPVVTLLIRTQTDANFAFISITVLLCTYISIGLIFIPKLMYLNHHGDADNVVAMQTISKLTRLEQKRLDELTKENLEIKKEIEMQDRKISECRERITQRVNDVESIIQTPLLLNDQSSLSEDCVTFSTPTTFTTTAFVESQFNNNNTGQRSKYDEEEGDGSSSYFDEIFL